MKQVESIAGRVVLAMMLFAVLAAPLHAQSTALLKGRVEDATGGGVAGAEVIARNVATGQQRSVHTDGTGGICSLRFRPVSTVSKFGRQASRQVWSNH